MKRFFTSIIIITLFFSIVQIVFAQPVQWPPQDVNISAVVPPYPGPPYDLPAPIIFPPPGEPIGAPLVKVINLKDTSCEITWYTEDPSTSIVDYGETPEYGSTFLNEELVQYHKVKLEGLKPKTTYHFRVRSRNQYGKEAATGDYTFTTLDLTPPANVSNFQARPGDRMITLTWANSPDEDFVGVKIQMSTKIYPGSPTEGTTVYDGKGETTETRSLRNGVRYYFTAFAYDDSKNYASGAIASAVPWPPEVPYPPEEIPYIPPELIPTISELTLEDISFFVEGVEVFPEDGVITVSAGQTFKISIPFEKLPKVLKTIITVIADDGSVYSYLLRINPEGTAYEATITAPEVPKTYSLTIVIMNFKEGTVAKIEAQLKVEGVIPLVAGIGEGKVSFTPLIILVSLVLVAGAAIGYLVGRCLKRKVQREKCKTTT